MPLNIFTPAQQICMIAIMDRIIPENDFPSASAAGVLNYIETLLTLEETLQSELVFGLEAFNRLCVIKSGSHFSKLSDEAQDAFLKACLSGSLRDEDQTVTLAPDLKEFVDLCIRLVSEGYYADPVNGGNRDSVSWNMIGFHVTDADLTATGGLV